MGQFCDLCNVDEENDDIHKCSSVHKFNFALMEFHNSRKKICGDRFGIALDILLNPLNGFKNELKYNKNSGTYSIEISPDYFSKYNCKLSFTCRITNKRTKREDPIVITYCGILHPYKHFLMADKNYSMEANKQLSPNAFYDVVVQLNMDQVVISNFNIPVYFTIQTKNKIHEEMQSFSIARAIVIQIGASDTGPDLLHVKNASPFTNNKKWAVEYVQQPKSGFYGQPDNYPIPKKYMKTLVFGLSKNLGDGVYTEIMQKLYPEQVTVNNYADFWHIMLWLEEMCAKIGLSCYNMENVTLKFKVGDILTLTVPGLAEKRPSVVKGDYIEIRIHDDRIAYRGVIKFVGDNYVDIHYLHNDIVSQVYHNPEIEIDVRFVLSRIHFERMHQGVDKVVGNSYHRNLFPNESFATNNRRLFDITEAELFNKKIYTNNEQRTAVVNILNNSSNGAPYIVFGPPGTGKTLTIVEAIFQLKRRTKYKILVCAPSNAACNMLTEKLAEFSTNKELIRVMSENADLSSVHEDIINYCNMVVDEIGKCVISVKTSELANYRIVVSTLVRSGLYTGEYHPDVIFIDEAAQAREPEACVAIGLLSKAKQLILAGDPKQLGPVIYSEVCRKYKYHVPLLERLMEFPVYKKENFMTMLKLNFRSHPDVLMLPNHFFYEDKLEAVSISAYRDPLANMSVYSMIVNKGRNKEGYPVEFCSVLAKERREGKSPSYYNPVECQMIVRYVKALTSIKFKNPNQVVQISEIGIVTPYIRQVYKIRQLLTYEQKRFGDIDVGTTEAFQGREKRVMIISTVRGQEDLLLFDKMYKLGFVREPKRFNVAVTRAKSKLIVIGNPQVLYLDKKFKSLIEQTKTNNSFYGAPYTPRNEEMRQDIRSRISYVKLKDKDPSGSRQ